MSHLAVYGLWRRSSWPSAYPRTCVMPDPDMLPAGKLPLDLLTELLAPLTPRDPRVRVGARTGEDAAIIDLGATLLVVAADPITFATDQIGRYAVAVNANDIAVRGATPRWFLATLLLPAGTTRAGVQAIMDDLVAACRELEIDLVGGHTEVTSGIDRPIVAGPNTGAGAAARRAGGSPPAMIAHAADLLRDPSISVVAMARALCDAVQPHAMHDPTEGGLVTALAELAAASGVGVHLEAPARLPFLPETRAFCRAFGLDPLGLLASGALLSAVDAHDVPPALDALRSCGAGQVI